MSFQSVPLPEVCEIIMGQAPVGSSYNESGEGLALIAGAGDFGRVTPEPKKYTTAASKISQADDLILCIRATIGDLNWSDKEYCLGRGVAGLRPKKAVLDKGYLWHFIGANKHQLSAKGTGSTFKQVSRSHIAEWKIPLPPLTEQKRIASILDKADAIRRKRQQAIQLADEFLRAVFLDMFGDPNSNTLNWDGCSLGELGGNVDNKRVPLKQSDREQRQGKYPYYGATGIIDAIDDYLFEGDHLLIAEDGKNLINRTKPLAFPASGKFWVNNHAHVINYTCSVNLTFLEFFLNLKDVRNYITGIDQFKLNRSSMDSISIFTPPITLQDKFASIVNVARNNLVLKHKSASELMELFNSLSKKSFREEL